MFKDAITQDAKVSTGDVGYIYEYKDRNKIKDFEGLTRIKITNIAQKKDDNDSIIVKGENLSGKEVIGILEYIVDGNIVKTAHGDKFINFYISGGLPRRCLRKPKKEYSYNKLYGVFSIDKRITIKIDIYRDLICLNEDNLSALIEHTKIRYPRLHNGYVSFFLNGEEVHIKDAQIYVYGKKYTGSNGLKEVFQWACMNKASIIDTDYNWHKQFSLKHVNYELHNIKI